MSSHPTLDQSHPTWDPAEERRAGRHRGEAVAHGQLDPDAANADAEQRGSPAFDLGVVDGLPAVRAEQTFDRLNPEFGVPADTRDPFGRQAVRDREAGLALGTRVAVAATRENDPHPVMRVAGQDYRAADAARQAARRRHGTERAGPER